MATYVVGDVQGCFSTFEHLLRRIDWDKKHDRLWLAGDLVNRGPRSLDMLRWAVDHDDKVTAVLGNHDIHLLAAAAGLRPPRPRDTIAPILALPSSARADLLLWTRTRPLVHVAEPFVMVHAGLWPSWTRDGALALSAEISAVLASAEDAVARVHGVPMAAWDDHAVAGDTRAGAALALLTRMRMIQVGGPGGADGTPLPYDGAPDDPAAPAGAVPWYAAPGRRTAGTTILFGHWAAHGFAKVPGSHIALDSGCVWGRALTAVRLDDLAVFQEPAADGAADERS